jgi:hypothetical protein
MTRLVDVPGLFVPVNDLYQCRGHLAAIKKPFADPAQGWLKLFHNAGLAVDSHGRKLTKEVTYIKPAYVKFDTKRFQRAHPTDYERFRLSVPHHSVKRDIPWDAGHVTVDFELPPVPDLSRYAGEDLSEALSELDDMTGVVEMAHSLKMRFRPTVAGLKRAEDSIKAKLEFACEPFIQQGGWDGEKWNFEDGWTYGCRQRQFSSELAVEALPARISDKFSTVVPEQEIRRVIAIDPEKPDEPVDLYGDPEPFEGD